MEKKVIKLPTIDDLSKDTDVSIKENGLMVLLNQEPPISWLKKHPTITVKEEKEGRIINAPYLYLPINKIEYLLSRIFTRWWVDIKSVQCLANSVVVCVRLHVVNPIDGEEIWQDGVGASPIQTDKGAGAMDWNKAKSSGVMMATPSAESYAIKDAAEKFGKLFGKDLNRKESMDYSSLLKTSPDDLREQLGELFELKKDSIANHELEQIANVLHNNETWNYKKAIKLLISK